MIEIDINKELHGQIGNINLEVNLHINESEFIAITGKSGSGKTTLLRVLAGLESADGKVLVDGKPWLEDKKSLAIQKRNIGFVFQDYALFENMNVLQNLLYVNKDKNLAFKLLEMTDLKNLINRHPNSLSGGQKQRLSICRALMNKPKLLLLDEPLSALDPKMRNSLQNEILALHKEFKTTTIMISHEPREIYKLSNRVILLEDGKILNDGTPKEVLLKTQGSQKFSFEGEILDIIKIDVVNIAIISIGQQLVEVVLSNQELEGLNVGSKINVGTKAFAPVIK